MECYHNKFNPSKPQCRNEAIWQGANTGNWTDLWTWCNDHAPQPKYGGWKNV